jgi:hypothetical protein
MKHALLAVVMVVTYLQSPVSIASTVVWDWSPATTGAAVTNPAWENTRPGRHYAEFVQFDDTADIDGMDIYGIDSDAFGDLFGKVGSPVVITIWSDSSGQPGSVLNQIFTTISAIDHVGASVGNRRLHTDLPSFHMLAKTKYWIGMAGDGIVFTQTGLHGVPGGDSTMANFLVFDSFGFFPDSGQGDMAFRLYGNKAVPPSNTVPIPTIGVGGLALLVAIISFFSGLLIQLRSNAHLRSSRSCSPDKSRTLSSLQSP